MKIERFNRKLSLCCQIKIVALSTKSTKKELKKCEKKNDRSLRKKNRDDELVFFSPSLVVVWSLSGWGSVTADTIPSEANPKQIIISAIVFSCILIGFLFMICCFFIHYFELN